MAELTFSHSITTSNIGLTFNTVLTAGFTFSVEGVSFSTNSFDLYTNISPLDFNLNSPTTGAFASVDSSGNQLFANLIATISPINTTISQVGNTWHHFFGLTLIDVVNNSSNSGFISQLHTKNNLLTTITDSIKYGAFGTISGNNFAASTNTNQTISGQYISITSASATGVAGGTISVSCDSFYTKNYLIGLGTTLSNGLTNIYSCVAILGCISGLTVINTSLTSTQINDILGDYFDTSISGNRQNMIRTIDTFTDEFKTDSSIFVIPSHIPSGKYHLIPLLREAFNTTGGFFTLTSNYLGITAHNLNIKPITITNNFVGMTAVYSADVSNKFIFPADRGFISPLFAYVDKVEPTPGLVVDNAAWGITSGFSTTPFNRMDYGFFSKGSTVYNSNSESGNFVPPLFGFIPLGLTSGATLTVQLNGITFYQQNYNPYKTPFGNSTQVAYFFNGLDKTRNSLFLDSIFNFLGTSTRKNTERLNKAFYRIDFNSISNPWGFTGFTFSGPSSSTLNFIYGNPSNGISFQHTINTVGNGLCRLTSGSNVIDINGGTGITVSSADIFGLSLENRPYGYLTTLNFYRGSDNTFVGGQTLIDFRLAETSQRPERSFQESPISLNANLLTAIGLTGTAKFKFTRADGISFEFASTPISTLSAAFNPVHTRGTVTGITSFVVEGRTISPAVDLMSITVNHGLTNLESSIVGRNSIHSRYYLGGNIDNLASGAFGPFYFVPVLDSIGPEVITNNGLNIQNRKLRKNFREAVNDIVPILQSFGTTLTVPLRNFEGVVNFNYPTTTILGNGVLTLTQDYFDANPFTPTQILSFADPFNYLHYNIGSTLIFQSAVGAPLSINGGTYPNLNNNSFIKYSNGNTFFPANWSIVNGEDANYLGFIFYDYKITAVTLSSSSNVGIQDSITTTITANDLPHVSIFDGLRLSVLNGSSELFTKNLFYSTNSSNDYRLPGYNTLALSDLASYYTATPKSITAIFVGSGSTLGGITITPPTTGWPASTTLTVRISPIFKSFVDIPTDVTTLRNNFYIGETTFTTAAQTTTGGGGGGSSSGSVSVSESVVTGVAFTSTENDFYAGFLCGTTAYNIITNNSTASYSVLTSSSTAYANAKAAFDAGTLTANTSTDVEIHSLLNFMDYGGNIIVSPTIDGLLGSNYEYDIVFTEDNKRYGELMRIGSEKNHAIVIVGTSLEEDAASFAAPAYTNLNSAGLADGLTYMAAANKGEYVFSVLGYKNRTRFYGSGTETVRLYLSSDVAGAYARSYVENKYHLSSSGSARGGIRTYSNITPTIVDRDLSGYYTRGINPIYIPSGTNRAAIWGDATGITIGSEIYRKSASVSKNTSTIKREFKKIFEDFQFEQNNAGTRAQFVSRATTVLDKLQSIGGLASYILICNETNNTPSVVAQKRLVVDLTIVPNNSIESIVLNFVLNQI